MPLLLGVFLRLAMGGYYPQMDRSRYAEHFEMGRKDMLANLDNVLNSDIAQARVVDKRWQLIVSDIEGCLNLDTQTYDFDILDRLRRVNQMAAPYNPIPYLTLCTGRPSPFVDAFSAFLGVTIPAIFEGGSGLFFPLVSPGRGRVTWHPLIGDSMKSGRYEIATEIVERIARDEKAISSPGKEYLWTFYPRQGQNVAVLTEIFRRELRAAGIDVEITHSANAVDITVPGVNKGTGVAWLMDVLKSDFGWNAKPEDSVAIGDAPNDLPLLSAAGRSVAPLNADEAIKEVVSYVSPFTDAKAVSEELLRCIKENMRDAG